MRTRGEIAVIFSGQEQVGGLYEWEASVEVRDAASTTRIAARGFWCWRTLSGDDMRLKLYNRQGERLVLINEINSARLVRAPTGEIAEGVLILRPLELCA
jgi:hypothetical protein